MSTIITGVSSSMPQVRHLQALLLHWAPTQESFQSSLVETVELKDNLTLQTEVLDHFNLMYFTYASGKDRIENI